MVVAIDVLTALVLALVFSLILRFPFERRGPGPLSGLVFFFLLFLFSIWALGVWLKPAGPMGLAQGLVFLIVGAIFALFFLMLVPRSDDRKVLNLLPPQEKRAAAAAETTLGLLFWLLILVLLGAIIVRYTWWPA